MSENVADREIGCRIQTGAESVGNCHFLVLRRFSSPRKDGVATFYLSCSSIQLGGTHIVLY